MNSVDAGYLLVAVLLAFVANDVWRVLGVLLSARINENSALFAWVKMVATALVAGLVAKLILSPTGGFALAPAWLRLATVACGVAAYWATRRSLAAGIVAGEVVLVSGVALLDL